MILLDSSHDSWENEVLFMKTGARVVDLDWIRLLGPSGPNVVSRSQTPKSRPFLRFQDFNRFISWFLKKWGPDCENWSQGSGLMAGYVFWTYGWICLLGPSGLNVVSRPQTPRWRHFLRFHDFIGFISWFLRKWGLVYKNWSQGSGLMAAYVFWAQVAQR